MPSQVLTLVIVIVEAGRTGRVGFWTLELEVPAFRTVIPGGSLMEDSWAENSVLAVSDPY